MSFDRQKLLELLPAFYRVHDDAVAKQTGHGPLAELLAVLAEQIAVLEEDIEQLQDDAFIETCAEWVVPYIGDLIGYKPLYGVAPRIASPRAEVAHTIAYRRRKGTALVLEQLARDVTGWNASAVEFFQRLITTQYMNHRRPWIHAAPDLRRWEPLDHVGTAFDTIPRSIDVRRIASRRGRHNIPNVGLFVWPLQAYSLSGSPAARVDDRRYRFNPLNHDQPLYTRPVTEEDITQLTTPINVPLRIGRRAMHERTSQFYTETALRRSVRVYVGTGEPLPPVALADIRACHLGDDGGTWAHLPTAGQYAIDPVLGRLALPPNLPPDTRVKVDFHYAFGADIGGGEYERADSFAEPATVPLRVPQDHVTIQGALDALAGNGVVEVSDSGRYEESLSIDVSAQGRIELRAANGHRPTLIVSSEVTLRGGEDAEIALNGLLMSGNRLHVPDTQDNHLRRLHLKHCTIVPGWTLAPDASPQSASEPSLVADLADLQIRVHRSIVGALHVVSGADCKLTDSILDATAPGRAAYAAPPDGNTVGGPLSLEGCTSIGKLHARMFPMISNSILVAELGSEDTWPAPVIAERRQQGCVRYSYLPATSRVPRRFRCVPGEDTVESASPRFLSLRYGHAVYAWLGASASAAVRRGADDEGEMGAYHHVHAPQREVNLRLRLDEYLRVGLEAGIFHET